MIIYCQKTVIKNKLKGGGVGNVPFESVRPFGPVIKEK